jgi:hypothetical protein
LYDDKRFVDAQVELFKVLARIETILVHPCLNQRIGEFVGFLMAISRADAAMIFARVDFVNMHRK